METRPAERDHESDNNLDDESLFESLFEEASEQHTTTQLTNEIPVVSTEQLLGRSSRDREPPKHLSDYVWTLDL